MIREEERAMRSGTQLVLVLVCAMVVLCVGRGHSQGNQPAAARLLADDAETRDEAKGELLAARADLISALVSIVGDEENQTARPESVRAAMFILGEMRATEAIGVLVANIAFPDTLPPPAAPPPGGFVGTGSLYTIRSRPLEQWPAVEALTKIGEPCLQPIIGKLATTGDVREMGACIRVLTELRDDDSASLLLAHAIAQQADHEARQRLLGALNLLLRAR
jgi:hypothetical protein